MLLSGADLFRIINIHLLIITYSITRSPRYVAALVAMGLLCNTVCITVNNIASQRRIHAGDGNACRIS